MVVTFWCPARMGWHPECQLKQGKKTMANQVTFHRAYDGGYLVKINGKSHSHIDRSMDGGGWDWGGMAFKYLAEAKARCRADIEN
jgi:hypothetical protein